VVPEKLFRMPSHCRIVHGDSLRLLPEMGDGEFDHIITDPPYGERTHAGARGGQAVKLVHFEEMTPERIVSFAKQSVRVARRWVVMTCEWQLAAHIERAMPEEFIRLGVWVKPDAGPQISADRPGIGWEPVVILHRAGKKRWNDRQHAVWTCKLDVSVKANRPHHPCQKPVELIRKWVRQFTDEGDSILDPFGGGGTTGEACLSERRRITLIESDQEWVDFMKRRLARSFPPLRTTAKIGD
jgi:site-specific DNA-methyltransferase (adenine-specific)